MIENDTTIYNVNSKNPIKLVRKPKVINSDIKKVQKVIDDGFDTIIKELNFASTGNKLFIPANNGWMSNMKEFMYDFIPGIIYKVRTACGLTSAALLCKRDTVICFPTNALLEDKKGNNKDINTFMFGFSEKERNMKSLTEYLNSLVQGEYIKIGVTYDSLPLLNKYLKDFGIDLSLINLVVDEIHKLTDAYSYRKEAIKNLKTASLAYRQVSWITATINEYNYTLEFLKKESLTTFVWEDEKRLNVKLTQCINKDQLLSEAAERIILSINNNYNLTILIDSLEAIQLLIKECELISSEVTLLYSKSNPKEIKDNKGNVIERGDISLPCNKISFLTNAYWDGVSLDNKTGKTIAIAGYKNKYIDIKTSLIQGAGRNRNSIYNNEIELIYKPSNSFGKVSTEDLISFYKDTFKKDEIAQEVKEANNTLNRLVRRSKRMVSIGGNTLDIEQFAKETIAAQGNLCTFYFNKEKSIFEYDEDKEKGFLFNHKLINEVYCDEDSLVDTINKAGLDILNISDSTIEITKFKIEKKKLKLQEEIINTGLIDKPSNKEIKDQLNEMFPWLEQNKVLDFVTIKEMEELEYHKANIIVRANKNAGMSKLNQIFKTIHGTRTKADKKKFIVSSQPLTAGSILTSIQIEEILENAYTTLEFDIIPNYKDIFKFYSVKEIAGKKKEKRDTKTFQILMPKIILG